MHLAGSISEIRGILQTAADLKADAIHFIAPSAIFILAENKQDYVYAKTDLLIGQSVLVPRITYQNMKLYIKSAMEGFKNHHSLFYGEKIETILFNSDRIYFNESDRLSVEADIITASLKKEVEFKIQETMQSSIHEKMPFIRFSKASLDFIKSEITKYKKRFSRMISSDNALCIEDGQIVLYYHHNGEKIRIETGIEDFFTNNPKTAFSFSDRALYLFLWLSRSAVCDEVAILPRKQYAIIEGHNTDLAIKVRTMLKNDILDKIV